jgi:GntR family transcriptional regulator / MocR family aminotransferase
MDLHVELVRTSPLRPQLERAIRESIRDGRLMSETRLPPSRTLARDLGISRGIVVEAYEQLAAEGYLIARRGDGTRVAAVASPVSVEVPPYVWEPSPRYELRTGTPDLATFPRHEWAAATARALRELPDLRLGYRAHFGVIELRRALAAYLGRVRAVVADPARIFVTCGCSHGMAIIWRALSLRGARRVAVEDPCWPIVRDTIVHAGLEPVPIPVDDHGMRIDALDRAEVSAVAISPAHQYPTGTVLAPERRGALIEWARRHDVLIVEDDYDSEFRYDRDPIGSLQGLAPDRVAYLGSVSKTLAPGMSLGWMVAPPALVPAVAEAMAGGRGYASLLVQAAYAGLLESGAVARHLRRMRNVYRARRDALVTALDDVMGAGRVTGASAGLHVVLWLEDDLDEQAVARACLRHEVAVDTLHGHCSVAREMGPALLLGYGEIDTPAIPAAVDAMHVAIAQARADARSGDQR